MTGDDDGSPHTQGCNALPCHGLEGINSFRKFQKQVEGKKFTCTNVVSAKLLVLFSTSCKVDPLILLRSSITDVLLLVITLGIVD